MSEVVPFETIVCLGPAWPYRVMTAPFEIEKPCGGRRRCTHRNLSVSGGSVKRWRHFGSTRGSNRPKPNRGNRSRTCSPSCNRSDPPEFICCHAGKEPRLQHRVGDAVQERPGHPDSAPTSRSGGSSAAPSIAVPTRRAISRPALQSHIAHVAHRKSLRQHPRPPSRSRRRNRIGARRGPRQPGVSGMVGDIERNQQGLTAYRSDVAHHFYARARLLSVSLW